MENTNTQLDIIKDTKTYEVGYLLSPLLPVDKMEEFTASLVGSIISSADGELVGQTSPRMRPLAYEITKSINNKNVRYKDAYLGSVKFKAEAGAIAKVQTLLDKNQDVIRFLLVNIPKRTEKVKPKKDGVRRPRVARDATKTETSAEKGTPMTSAEIDKEIEGLIADTNV